MNLTDLERKLLNIARANPPSEKVPYAFEKRIMARLKDSSLSDRWHRWAGALWRAAVPCVAITMVLSTWAFFSSPAPGSGPEYFQEIESTVLAAAEQESVNINEPSW